MLASEEPCKEEPPERVSKNLAYTLKDFTYDLPRELIAQKPAEPRDHARLLIHDRKTEEITDDRFYNIGRYLPENTTLVVNNSRVEKCRLHVDGGGKEIFIAKIKSDNII